MIELDTKVSKDINVIKNNSMMARTSVEECSIIVRNMQGTVAKNGSKTVENQASIFKLQELKLDRKEFMG